MPSDSRNYFGFVVGEFSELVHTTKSFVIRLPVTVMPGMQKCSPNSHRKPHANLLRVFDVCLEMPSDSKNYFDFLLDEFFRACADHKIAWLLPLRNHL